MPVTETERTPLRFRFQLIPHAVVCFAIAVFMANCAHPTAAHKQNPEDCLVEIALNVRAKPAKKYLHTLDGRDVLIDDFLHQCEILWPECCLYEKFYYWDQEVLTVESGPESGSTKRHVRAYYNPLSVCKPEKVHPGRKFGDVAEIYDSEMRFTGLSVYMGNGLYVHLPYNDE